MVVFIILLFSIFMQINERSKQYNYQTEEKVMNKYVKETRAYTIRNFSEKAKTKWYLNDETLCGINSVTTTKVTFRVSFKQ